MAAGWGYESGKLRQTSIPGWKEMAYLESWQTPGRRDREGGCFPWHCPAHSISCFPSTSKQPLP